MSISRWLQNRKIQAALIMVLTLLLLVATEPQIGLTWDEDIYMRASGMYTSWLGKLITQPAEALSKGGIYRGWEFNHEHPPLDKIWSGIVWQGARFIFDDLTAHRLGNMILASGTVGVLYLLIAESYGLAAGFAAAAALLTMPRFFLHAHLAALDMPAACAVFIATFLFWKTKDNPSWKWTLILGLVWGLALATKSSAIFVPAILFLWALIFCRQLKLLVRIVVMSLIGVPFSFAIWPWIYPDIPGRVWDFILWNSPIAHTNIAQWYLGELYMPPPWHYTFVVTWAIIPLTLTVLYLIGIVRAGRKWREADSLGGLLFLGALLPLLALAIGQASLYDQERIFMPIFPFLAALAGIGFGWLVIGIQWATERMRKPRWAVSVTVLAVVLAFLPQSISMVRLYPHLLSYYSENVGGLPGANRMGMETTYWCESYAAAIPYLNEHAQPGDMVWVDPFSQNVLVYYQVHGQLRDDIKIAYSSVLPRWPFVYEEYGPPTVASFRMSDVIVLQYRQTLMGSTPQNPDRDFYSPHPDFQWAKDHEPVYQLSHDGVPIMEIYSTPKTQASELGQAAVQVPADWRVFESEAGNFTIQVPPTLEFTERTEKVDDIITYLYENFAEGEIESTIIHEGTYAIAYADFPPEVTADPNASQPILIYIRDDWIGAIGGTLIEERSISLGDHPGKEFIAETEYNGHPIKLKVRQYLVQNRYYQITVGIPEDRTFAVEQEAFLQSFALLED